MQPGGTWFGTRLGGIAGQLPPHPLHICAASPHFDAGVLANDWIVDLFLARHGKVVLQNSSYIVIGEKGVSRTNALKPFRVNWIEGLFPLYTFHKKFNILIDTLNFIDKCVLTFKVIDLHSQLIKIRTVVFIKKNVFKKKC